MTRTRMTNEMIMEVLRMRIAGYRIKEIATKYGKDHSTISHHCIENGISVPRVKRRSKRMIEVERVKEKLYILDEEYNEVINRGKNYADYLIDEKNRNWSKRNDIAKNGI